MTSRLVCLGMISLHKQLEHVVIRESRHETIHDLNMWFFDYFRLNNLPIVQLPPLDDWTQSREYPALWHITFGTEQWVVTTTVVNASEGA